MNPSPWSSHWPFALITYKQQVLSGHARPKATPSALSVHIDSSSTQSMYYAIICICPNNILVQVQEEAIGGWLFLAAAQPSAKRGPPNNPEIITSIICSCCCCCWPEARGGAADCSVAEVFSWMARSATTDSRCCTGDAPPASSMLPRNRKCF